MSEVEVRAWFDERVNADLASGTTLSVVCNQDRGSWAATKRLAEAFGLSEPRD